MVDAARTQVFAGFSWESGAHATTLFSGAERYFARSGLSAWETALLLFEVSFHHARCAGGQGRERKGREANGEIAGCTHSTTVNSNANDTVLFPARQQNQHSFTVGISNDSRGHECTHCAP